MAYTVCPPPLGCGKTILLTANEARAVKEGERVGCVICRRNDAIVYTDPSKLRAEQGDDAYLDGLIALTRRIAGG